MALVERRPNMHVADLGCGIGELTRVLHEHLQAKETIGIDNSASMLARAPSASGLSFENATIESFDRKRFDLIFSNAAFHWVADHASLFRRLTSLLTGEGQLAVQMPANEEHPSHAVAAEVAYELGMQPKPVPVLAPEKYAQLLFDLGYRRQHVRTQIYGHVLPSSEEVIEWVKGTLLTYYEGRDPQFMPRYRQRLMQVIGERRPYFYTYKRILIWSSF
jgi:trans-aconitate 2-methyltransferase